MSMSGWCSSSSATSATAFTKSIAPAKSSNSNVRSMCFFSSSHSGTFFRRIFASSLLIRSAITGQRVTPQNRFAMANQISFLRRIRRRFSLSSRVAKTARDPHIVVDHTDSLIITLNIEDLPQILLRIENLHRASARLLRQTRPIRQNLLHRNRRGRRSIDKQKPVLTWKIFCGASVFRDDGASHGKKSGRAVAQPAGLPGHVNALYRGEFSKRASQITPVFSRRSRHSVRIDNAPATFLQARPFRITGIDIHRQFELRFRHLSRKIEIGLKRELLRKIGEFAGHFNRTAPVPLPDGCELGRTRTRTRPQQSSIDQRVKCFPIYRRSRQPAIASANVQPDRPELVMMRLAHFHLRHPIKNFARIEIAKQPVFELEQEGRMNGITEIEQHVWPGETLEQFRF